MPLQGLDHVRARSTCAPNSDVVLTKRVGPNRTQCTDIFITNLRAKTSVVLHRTFCINSEALVEQSNEG